MKVSCFNIKYKNNITYWTFSLSGQTVYDSKSAPKELEVEIPDTDFDNFSLIEERAKKQLEEDSGLEVETFAFRFASG